MLYVLHMIDKPGVLDKRMAALPAHRDYLEQAPIEVVMSGPLQAEDGETIVGSLYLVEVEKREDIDAFLAEDPLANAGVWDRVDINRFFRRVG
ncbi:MAG: YciI family protein [Defluviicoccus sp.]|nr:YciI family protein [Defluviicoccus sp.]MDE0386516.1 YciI family protein [Defluviicoccus sp.]